MPRTYSPEVLEYLARFDARLLQHPEGRRVLTRLEPKLFVLTYLIHHVTDSHGHVSFSEVHDDWCRQALEWLKTSQPRAFRRAYVAPRSMGKSTWWWLILPLWSAAHGHKQFGIAFADSAAQATQHLGTFKRELETNELLRRDFPDLCKPARRPSGVTEADSRDMFRAANGFTLIAKGVDSASLGAKQGNVRPDLLIFDDVEGAPGTYSVSQAASRLSTITEGLFPLNELASVVMVGTTTIPGGIMHQLVQSVNGGEVQDWIKDERVRTCYYDPIPTNEDGTRRSVWPEKWSLQFLESLEHTRSFALNYRNDPSGYEGEYWTADDFHVEALPSVSRRIISIDPAVTTKRTSDQTAVAVVSFSAAARKASVDEVVGYRLKGEPLRQRILDLLAKYPDVAEIVWESNNGGDMLPQSLLHDMPVPVRTLHQSEKKEIRAERLLTRYRRGQVVHAQQLREFETQALAFPKGLHDDLVDAVGTGVEWLAQTGSRRFAVASR